MSKNKNKKKIIPALDNSAIQQDAEIISIETEEDVKLVEEAKDDRKAGKELKADKLFDKKAKKAKKEKKPSRIKRMFKETGSELKKVSWPTFPKVVRQTGIVLAVVIFFGVILFAFDYILTVLFKLLNSQAVTAVEKWVSIGLAGVVVLIVAIWLTIWLVKRKRDGRNR